MKKILGFLRRADEAHGLIDNGDKIAIGVSGGKDSMVMLHAMNYYQKYFSRKDFSITAVCLSVFEDFDPGPIAGYCEKNSIPFILHKTNIGKVVFEDREEKNPCALCAKLRRGALNSTAKRLGCNKVALGHSREDVLHTFLLSLLYEARLNVFRPKTYLDRTEVTVIRPLVYAKEKDIIALQKKDGLPVVKNPCPASGNTQREQMKEIIKTLEQTVPNAREMLMSAIVNSHRYHLWR